MSDDEQHASGNVRRVTAKDRKEKLDYGQTLFPQEQPLAPDPHADEPPPGEPLPFDESAFAAQTAERFPPLPFDGDEAAFVAQQAEAERFPPLPPPAWARPHDAEPTDTHDDLDDITFEPETAAPVLPPQRDAKPPRRKAVPKAKTQRKTSRARGCLYNLLTLLFFALTIGALAYGIHIFNNPYSPLNVLPPPTALPIFITATPAPPVEAPLDAATATPLTLDLNLTNEEAPAEVTPAPTATYTPLPPEALTEMAPPSAG